jgi:ribosome biogenesis ATPase
MDTSKASRITLYNLVRKQYQQLMKNSDDPGTKLENAVFSQIDIGSYSPELVHSTIQRVLSEAGISDSKSPSKLETDPKSVVSKRHRQVENSIISTNREEKIEEKQQGDKSPVPEKKRRILIRAKPSSSELLSSNNSSSSFLSDRPTARLSDLAGLTTVINEVKELVCHPLEYHELYQVLGVCPPCGLLFHGPSGCGKSALANALAGETGLSYFKVSGPELIGGTSGESEENIRRVFDAAISQSPSILFIDAFEVLAAKRDQSQRGMDRRIVAQLIDCMDQLISCSKKHFQLAANSTVTTTTGNNNNNNNNTNSTSSSSSSTSTALITAEKTGYVVLIAATNK